jgi:hypothetical protein
MSTNSGLTPPGAFFLDHSLTDKDFSFGDRTWGDDPAGQAAIFRGVTYYIETYVDTSLSQK